MRNSSELRIVKEVSWTPRCSLLFLLLLFSITGAPVFSQHRHAENGYQYSQQSREGPARPSHVRTATNEKEIVINGHAYTVPDVLLVTQDGKKVRFYSDLIKDKAVVLGFFYTSCVFLCPRHGQLFSKLQDRLGQRLGKDVFLISVSMDPQTDTPLRLAKWGARYGRKPGWTLVTGKADEMEKVLKALTGNGVGPRDEHSSFVYVANDKTGRWSFMSASVSPVDIEEKLAELALP